MKKLLYGVALNDADYVTLIREELPKCDGKRTRKVVWQCPFHLRWSSMITRCYSEKLHSRAPTYESCLTISEWHYFMTFRSWMEKQDWQNKHLDKDILFPGNKVYSPDTCVFVDQKVNKFILETRSELSQYKIGVSFSEERNKFCASGKDFQTGKTKNLGRYDTEDEAHIAWLTEKRRQARLLASEQTDLRVAKALIDRYENYTRT